MGDWILRKRGHQGISRAIGHSPCVKVDTDDTNSHRPLLSSKEARESEKYCLKPGSHWRENSLEAVRSEEEPGMVTYL